MHAVDMRRRPRSASLVLATAFVLASAAACRTDLRDEPAPADPPVTDDDDDPTSSTTSEPIDTSSDDGPEVRLDVPAQETTSVAVDPTCASFTASGAVVQKPADIIFVVDNSPSMLAETTAVQDNLNTFSQQIVDAGIDIRVLLMTAYPDPNAAPSVDTGICIEPPLGGGGCPTDDDNPPIFAHMQQIIGSEHALAKVIQTHPNWAPMMRPDSTKHIIVVSDDDSYMSAGEFDEAFRALDPTYADYRLHGIVSASMCPEAGNIGAQYLQLAELTGGTTGDLCLQEFQPAFDVLSTAVTEGTTLACAWPMPDAPEGKTIDPDSIELVLTIDGSVVSPVRVDAIEDCVDGTHAWYFDDPEDPQSLVSCATTCDALTNAATAELDIEVGCATPVAG